MGSIAEREGVQIREFPVSGKVWAGFGGDEDRVYLRVLGWAVFYSNLDSGRTDIQSLGAEHSVLNGLARDAGMLHFQPLLDWPDWVIEPVSPDQMEPIVYVYDRLWPVLICQAFRRSVRGVSRWFSSANTTTKSDSCDEALKPKTELARQDLRAFCTQCCEKSPGGRVQASRLYEAYTWWCALAGVQAATQTAFGRAMAETDIEKEKDGCLYYKGITLTPRTETLLDVRQ